MRQLKYLLYSDLQRQYSLEGRSERLPNAVRLLARVLHHCFLPILLYRLSRAAMLAGIPLVPKLMTYANIVLFGLEIPAGCEIGPGLFLPHTTGTVVGAWRMGANVTVFQGVTIGAKDADMNYNPDLRPEVGDNVVLGAGCKILGGIRLGNGVMVGANSVVLKSVEDNATVVGIPAKVVSQKLTGSIR